MVQFKIFWTWPTFFSGLNLFWTYRTSICQKILWNVFGWTKSFWIGIKMQNSVFGPGPNLFWAYRRTGQVSKKNTYLWDFPTVSRAKIKPVWKHPACPSDPRVWKNRYIQKLTDKLSMIPAKTVMLKQIIKTCFRPYLSAKRSIHLNHQINKLSSTKK